MKFWLNRPKGGRAIRRNIGQPGFRPWLATENIWNIDFILNHDFWGCQVHETSSIIHQKKPKSLDFHHGKGYQDPSTWARVKGDVKMPTNSWTTCIFELWGQSKIIPDGDKWVIALPGWTRWTQSPRFLGGNSIDFKNLGPNPKTKLGLILMP